jgi:cytoskeleton protein RodZ
MASFGKHLRTERELRGISLEEISQATKISRRFLEYLEDDRLDRLPGGIFPRAFVRQYARYIGLDSEKAVSEFVYVHNSATEPPAPSNDVGDSKSARSWLGIGIVIVLLAVFWTWSRLRSERSSVDPSSALPVVVSPPPQAAEVFQSGQPEVQGLVMTLKAKENCWIEARVDGQVIMNRLLNQGETTTLEAVGEIRLSVGNAGGLMFDVNNRPGLPLGRSGEVKRDIRITRENLPSLVQSEPSERSLSS